VIKECSCCGHFAEVQGYDRCAACTKRFLNNVLIVESAGHDGSPEFIGKCLPLSGRYLWVPLQRFLEVADVSINDTHLYRADTGELDGLRKDIYGSGCCKAVH
jgi:hypothetical protein